MNKASKYFPALTSLRGIAAIWVAVFHIEVIVFYRDVGYLFPKELTGIVAKGYLWVDFFFMLSGFIICHVYGHYFEQKITKKNVLNYVWARFIRLYPLHFFTTLFLIFFVLLVPLKFPELVDESWQSFFNWSVLWTSFLFTNALNQYTDLSWNIMAWSIGAEWWTYFVGILLLKILHQSKNLKSWLAVIFSFSALVLLMYWHKNQNLDITFDFGFFRCLFEFTIGIALYQFYKNNLGKSWLSKNIVFLLLFLGIIVVFHFQLNDLFIIPIYALLILSAVHNESKVQSLLNLKVFRFLGDISYSIYLVHGVWFMIFWFGVDYLKISAGLSKLSFFLSWIFAIIFLFLTIISSYFTHQYIEVKMGNFLRNLWKKNN